MAVYRLRIEGVNLNKYIDDSQDLSTIRGGGLILLDATKWIKKRVSEHFEGRGIELDPISTGASSGLYEIDLEPEDIQPLIKDLRDWMNRHYALKHAMIMFDMIKSEGDFITDKETLIALNRWRQMRSPSIAVPDSQAVITGICSINRVRPANKKSKLPENPNAPVSDSAKSRRVYGVNKKQKFYEDQTEMQISRKFTNDFQELTDEENPGNLHHKMAVIYIDGNDFGAIQRNNCKSKEKQNEFDKYIQGARRNLLTKLIRHMENNPQGWIAKDKHRFETLLWGGDEIIWVVPAWKGWETLKFFYDNSKDWDFNNNPLKHAAGLVFCHHNAPIHRITDLAKKLAEKAKDLDRSRNLFAYEILESFDHVSGDLDDYRKKRSPGRKNPDALILDGEQMATVAEKAPGVLAHLSRRKLHRLAKDVILEDWAPTANDREDIDKMMMKDLPEYVSGDLFGIKKALGRDDACWLHLAALWDYIA